MSEFVFTYRMPSSFVLGQPAALAVGSGCFADIGAIVDQGQPACGSTTVGRAGVDTHVVGYSVVDADSLNATASIAKTCPTLAGRSGVEIATIVEFASAAASVGEPS